MTQEKVFSNFWTTFCTTITPDYCQHGLKRGKTSSNTNRLNRNSFGSLGPKHVSVSVRDAATLDRMQVHNKIDRACCYSPSGFVTVPVFLAVSARGRRTSAGGTYLPKAGWNEAEKNKLDGAQILSHALLCFVNFVAMFR